MISITVTRDKRVIAQYAFDEQREERGISNTVRWIKFLSEVVTSLQSNGLEYWKTVSPFKNKY